MPPTLIDTMLGTLKSVSDRLSERIGTVEQQQAATISRLEARLDGLLQARALEQAAHSQQVEALVARVATLEARTPTDGRDGRDGLPGERGPQGEKGLDGREGLPGPRGERGLAGEVGPVGPIGPPGPAGPAGPAGPRGERGERGEPGLPGASGERGLAGERGERGESGLPGRDGRDGLPGPQGEKGLDGAPGQDGRHGLDGKDGADGVSFEDLTFGFDLETKTLSARAARGDRVLERSYFLPVVIYRGVWEFGRTYLEGDQVTWAGSQWIARATTTDRPDETGMGARTWVLSAKRGRDGKPGPPGPAGKDS